MEPWYKVATPRKEVREGRYFNTEEATITPSALYHNDDEENVCKIPCYWQCQGRRENQ
jgi:hypothetical protein